MELWHSFLQNKDRPIHKWAHYFDAYERHFRRYVGRPVVVFEIGCGRGGSLQMWKRYFGPLATIVGMDIAPRCKGYEEDQIHVRIGDQSDHAFLESVIEEFGTPDIVIDDGSHVMSHINSTFDYLFQRTDRHGVYLVEDLHTAYMENFEGGYLKKTTFIERCKGFIDELHAPHSSEIKATEITRSTVSMHIYDSIVVLEKGELGKRRSILIPSS
ncbi:class I SAM-dependent methyltransferase [Aquisalinus flavus]|uniref:SAM-dependent methyltransferase n=1 Tax=Aquisalinus flavus TaxID=1526572 RepID=A0A8J2V5U0_9PROT|nr:class I SAM-dependent methyltransferase [Aquisalinus flavus]MBD0426965.1 class I SAM-dependent methyltransferase [Aquisalinus flavus]UNE46801.1 class I SAM-dependent methyltransferase [Aquisalinus flavus]GGC97304.1 SAM-dependent methyltransferase [Aquisalinus flavus]